MEIRETSCRVNLILATADLILLGTEGGLLMWLTKAWASKWALAHSMQRGYALIMFMTLWVVMVISNDTSSSPMMQQFFKFTKTLLFFSLFGGLVRIPTTP